MKYEVFKDSSDEYRWRLKAANGETIADSGEGYKNRQDCMDAVAMVRNSASAPVEELQKA